MDFTKRFKTLRIWFYTEILLGILVFAFILNSLIYFRRYFLFYFALAAGVAVLELFVIRKAKNTSYISECTDFPSDNEFEKHFDKYGRRLINWILIAFLEVFSFLMSLVSYGINSKISELFETFNGYLLAFEIVAFFLIKNLFITKWLVSIHEFSNKPKLFKTLKRVIIGAAIYWAIALGVFFAFEYVFVLDIFPFLTGIFNAGIIILNLTSIKKIAYNKKKAQQSCSGNGSYHCCCCRRIHISLKGCMADTAIYQFGSQHI